MGGVSLGWSVGWVSDLGDALGGVALMWDFYLEDVVHI